MRCSGHRPGRLAERVLDGSRQAQKDNADADSVPHGVLFLLDLPASLSPSAAAHPVETRLPFAGHAPKAARDQVSDASVRGAGRSGTTYGR